MQELTKFGSNDQRRLTAVEFQDLARIPGCSRVVLPTWTTHEHDAPTTMTWKTSAGVVGLASADEFRVETRSHVLAWRAQLEHRDLEGATIRRK